MKTILNASDGQITIITESAGDLVALGKLISRFDRPPADFQSREDVEQRYITVSALALIAVALNSRPL